MHIILGMTGMTGCRQLDFHHIFLAMTRVTTQPLMRSGERKLGLLVMVETPESPAIGIVARPAFRTQTAFMVRILMTSDASRLHVLERRRLVTFLARHHRMLADEREAREIMVECNLLAPVRLVMTLLAAVSQLSLVRIVLFVTGVAVPTQLVAVNILPDMAGVALDLDVRALQRKFRIFRVIEFNGLPFFRVVALLALRPVPAGM